MYSIVDNLFVYFLTTIGLWTIYKKFGLDRKKALIPLYRWYEIADFLSIEETGGTYLISGIVYYALLLFQILSNGILADHIHTHWVINIIAAVFDLCMILYGFRIFSEIRKELDVTGKLTFLYAILWFIPITSGLLVIWLAYTGKEVPLKLMEKKEIPAAEHGIEVPVLSKGLTVNLKDRSVRTLFKKKTLLRDIHLNITPNKMVLLLGGSGAGKTTFLNAITGYEQANAKIVLNGVDVYRDYSRMKYEIGFVPQQDLIRYEDSVIRTLRDSASMRLPVEMTRKEVNERVEEVLDIFGLKPVRNNLVSKQSGGQKKRISIAMEFISNPSLFILDEPDSGLDGILARELMQRLHDIAHQDKIVVVITHTPDRVIDLFDEVIVLGKDADRTGRLVFHGSIRDAKEFFQVETMEQIIRKINCVDEGGEGLTDTLIQKYEEAKNGTN